MNFGISLSSENRIEMGHKKLQPDFLTAVFILQVILLSVFKTNFNLVLLVVRMDNIICDYIRKVLFYIFF